MTEQRESNNPLTDAARDTGAIQDLDATVDADDVRGGREPVDGVPVGHRQYGG